jgi:hypothetical protein
MTIRESLNKKITRVMAAALLSFALAGVSGFLLNDASRHPSLITFIGITGFALCVLYMIFGLRCPKCRVAIGGMISAPGANLFRVSNQIKFCPYCGTSLDIPLDEA